MTVLTQLARQVTGVRAAAPGEPAHPAGTPGAYRPTRRLVRLLRARSPRCEWPGCGARATACDLDHDTAWPQGPTCACNLGPLCRRHHRCKQTSWTKQRTRDGGVRWTSPSGKSWTTPSQHQPPQPAVRALPPLPITTELDDLSPLALEDELRHLDPGSPIWHDPLAHELRADDTEPEDDDGFPTDTTWNLDLDDPYAWLDLPHPADA